MISSEILLVQRCDDFPARDAFVRDRNVSHLNTPPLCDTSVVEKGRRLDSRQRAGLAGLRGEVVRERLPVMLIKAQGTQVTSR